VIALVETESGTNYLIDFEKRVFTRETYRDNYLEQSRGKLKEEPFFAFEIDPWDRMLIWTPVCYDAILTTPIKEFEPDEEFLAAVDDESDSAFDWLG